LGDEDEKKKKRGKKKRRKKKEGKGRQPPCLLAFLRRSKGSVAQVGEDGSSPIWFLFFEVRVQGGEEGKVASVEKNSGVASFGSSYKTEEEKKKGEKRKRKDGSAKI